MGVPNGRGGHVGRGYEAMKGLRKRLGQLGRALLPASGRCPACPPVAFVSVDADGNVLDGAYPVPCSRCGGPYDDGIRYVEVLLPREDEADPGAVDCR